MQCKPVTMYSGGLQTYLQKAMKNIAGSQHKMKGSIDTKAYLQVQGRAWYVFCGPSVDGVFCAFSEILGHRNDLVMTKQKSQVRFASLDQIV